MVITGFSAQELVRIARSAFGVVGGTASAAASASRAQQWASSAMMASRAMAWGFV